MARRRNSIVRRREGSLHWHYDWMISGRRLRGSTGTSDKDRAIAIAIKIRQEAIDTVYGIAPQKPTEMTLRAARLRYWEEHAKHLGSWKAARSRLNQLERLLGSDTLLSDITQTSLKAFAHARIAEGAAPATANRALSTFRRLLRMAREDWNVAATSPRFGDVMMPEPPGRQVFLTYEEADRLIHTIIPHAQPIVRLALYTGLRRGNINQLRWEQVDLDAGRLTVTVKHHHREGKTHTVPLIPDAVELLKSLAPSMKERIGHVFKYGNVHVGCTCPTCQHRADLAGRPILDIKKSFNTARKKAGLSHIKFHDLRHTVASWLIQGGSPLNLVKDVLGHSDIRVTARYAHLETAAAANAMANALSLPRSPEK